MTSIVVALGFVALCVALLRWLWVSQLEHYIPGSCSRTLGRWVRSRSPNLALAVALVALGVAVTVLDVVDSSATEVLAVLALAIGVAFPYPMPIVGRRNKLRRTRRLITLSLTASLLAAGLVALLALVGLSTAFVVAVLVVPLLVDVAAACNRPIEESVGRRWQRRARGRIDSVRPTVVAITGSYGKTSTKEHVRDLLDGSVQVVATPASWNNAAGLSRAVNERLGASTEVFVAEMGTYGRGEIAKLCEWLRPSISVITAIGPVHLERMGSLDEIAAAKSEILETADTIVLAVDDERLAALADVHEALGRATWRIRAGRHPPAAPLHDRDVHVGRRGESFVISTKDGAVGTVPSERTHPTNVGCAVAVAIALGLDSKTIGSRLARLKPTQHRAEVQEVDGLVVIDDTFNSNPAGAAAALERLVRATPDGQRVVATPGMVELGATQHEANRAFAEAALELEATLLVIGWTNRAALTVPGHEARTVTVADLGQARDWVRSHLGPGDGVLWENDLPDHYP